MFIVFLCNFVEAKTPITFYVDYYKKWLYNESCV